MPLCIAWAIHKGIALRRNLSWDYAKRSAVPLCTVPIHRDALHKGNALLYYANSSFPISVPN